MRPRKLSLGAHLRLKSNSEIWMWKRSGIFRSPFQNKVHSQFPYDHWRSLRSLRSLRSWQSLRIDFHKIAGIVEIAGPLRSLRSLQSLCFDFRMIAGIVAIAAITALVFSIKSLRSLTILHDRGDRLWFYPSDLWQLLGSLVIANKKENFVSIWSLRSLNSLLAIPAIVNDRQRSYGNQAFCNCRVPLSIFFSSVTRHCETKTFEIFCLPILFFQQQTGTSSIKLKYLV